MLLKLYRNATHGFGGLAVSLMDGNGKGHQRQPSPDGQLYGERITAFEQLAALRCPAMGESDADDDSPETIVDSSPLADTELAPSIVNDQLTAWALDDGPEWKPPFWTSARITAVAVASAVLIAIVVAGFVGYNLKPEPSATAPTTTRTAVSTEPSPHNSVSTPSPTPAPAPPAEVAPNRPPTPVMLPTSTGSAWVGTRSGRTFCQVTAGSVVCLVDFAVPTPMRYGAPANGVSISITGDFEWTVGDRGEQPVDTLDYGTVYRAMGWTIRPTSEDTTFINDTSGHGMTVSVEGVQPF